MSIIEREELRELLADQRALRETLRDSPHLENRVLKEIRRIKMAIQEDRSKYEWSGFIGSIKGGL